MPRANNWMDSRLENVVFPEEDGPDIKMIRTSRRRSTIIPAISAMRCSWRASDTRELSFVDCRVPEDNLLGKRGGGLRQFLETLDEGRLGVSAMGVGLAQGCFEMSLNYAQERTQFGQPIFQFQATQFKLVDMAMNLELARLMCYKAATLKDEGKPYAKEAAMAKLFSSEAGMKAALDGVQIHGGYGCMDDCPISRFYRDAKFLTIGEGTSEILRLVIARETIGATKKAFYWKNKSECDFLLRKAQAPEQAIQVCSTFTRGMKEREIKGLLEAMYNYKLKSGLAITLVQMVKSGTSLEFSSLLAARNALYCIRMSS